MNWLCWSDIKEHEVPIGHGHSSLFSRSSPPTAAVDAASDQPDERRNYDGDCCQRPYSHWPLSVWLSPELQALSRQQSLLPPAIWEKLHTPKGMELVPWVGGPSLLAKTEENQQEQQQEQLSTDSPPMESSGEAESQTLLAPEGQQQQQQQWTIAASEDNLHDVIMEP